MRHDRARGLDRSVQRSHKRSNTVAAMVAADQAGVAHPLPSLDPSVVPDYASEAIDNLIDAGKQGFLVGGFVRDALRGTPPLDVDIATDALWYQTRDIFMSRGYKVVETGTHHGTVTVYINGHHIEITTFRTDGAYSDHRRPDSVRYVTNIEDDLARRDFTVNAMAWSPTAGLVDPFGGRDDLAAGVVRSVGDPEQRFTEDALRIMRGVRLASFLQFTVEDETAEAIHDRVTDLVLIARERIAAEYNGIVCGKGAVEALRSFADVAAIAVPAIAAMVGFDQRSRWHNYDVWEHCLHTLDMLEPAASPMLRHTALLHDIGKPAAFSLDAEGHGHFYGHEEQGARIVRRAFEYLHWNRAEINRMCCLIRLHDRRIEPTPRGVRRTLARISSSFPGAEASAEALFEDLLMLKSADARAHAPSCSDRRLHEVGQVAAVYHEEQEASRAFCLRDLAIGGDDLLALGMTAGPLVGQTLQRLLTLVIDGEVPNERESLLAAVRS